MSIQSEKTYPAWESKNNRELIAYARDWEMLPGRLVRDADMTLTMTKLAVALEAAAARSRWVEVAPEHLRRNIGRKLRIESPACGTFEGVLRVLHHNLRSGVTTLRIRTRTGLVAIPATGATLLVRK